MFMGLLIAVMYKNVTFNITGAGSVLGATKF